MNFKREAIIMLLIFLSVFVVLAIAVIPSYYKQREKAQRIAENYVVFRATVRFVQPLSQIKEPTILVHFDSRFALALDVETACPNSGIIQPGDRVVLAIHSPSKIFIGEDPIGKTFFFTAEKIKDEKGIRLANLTVKEQKR